MTNKNKWLIAIGSFVATAAAVFIITKTKTGNEDKPPRGSFWMHPGIVTVTKLPSVTPEEYKDLSAFALKNLVRDRIATHLDAEHLRRTGCQPVQE